MFPCMTGKPSQLQELAAMAGTFGGRSTEGSVDNTGHWQIHRNMHADPAFVVTTTMKWETVNILCSPEVKTCPQLFF